MELGDILVKIATNAPLTPLELDFLKNAGRETQLRNAFLAGNTTAQNNLKVDFPFVPIYSEIFPDNKTSITIRIPPDYRHLMVMSAGRTTGAGTSNAALLVEFNDDTSASYNTQKIAGVNTTVTAEAEVAVNSGILGQLTEDGNTAGKSGTTMAFIPHYNSNTLYKTSFTLATHGGSTYFAIFIIQSTWGSTEPIQKMKIYSSSDSMKAGMSLSIYGIK